MKKMDSLSISIEKEVEKIKTSSDSSEQTVESANRVGGRVFARAVKLLNPKINTEDKSIEVLGDVSLISLAELVKIVKNRYSMPGQNLFPQVVDEFLFISRQAALGRLKGFDTIQQKRINDELANLARIVRVPTDMDRVVLVRRVKPAVEFVDEYVVNGRRVSGELCQSFELPVAVQTDDGAVFEMEESSFLVGSAGRMEGAMQAALSRITMVVENIENNTVQVDVGIKNLGIANAMAIGSLLMMLAGGVAFIEKRLIFFISLLILGVSLALLRFFPSNWNRQFFGMTEVRVVGNAYIRFKFFGNLAGKGV